MAKRNIPALNAGSMADIAFILLLFFLVATKLQEDKGIKFSMWPSTETHFKWKTENLLNVDVLADGSLLVKNNRLDIEALQDEVITFLTNEGKNPAYSETYSKAMVYLTTDAKAPYEDYIEVYSTVKSAFGKLRDDYAIEQYGKPLAELHSTSLEQEQAKAVRKKYPLKFIEAPIN